MKFSGEQEIIIPFQVDQLKEVEYMVGSIKKYQDKFRMNDEQAKLKDL
jgi:hypothetical protein